jgi:hypothetical protein
MDYPILYYMTYVLQGYRLAEVLLSGTTIDNHFQGQDDHVLKDGSHIDSLIILTIIVLSEAGPLSLRQDYHVVCGPYLVGPWLLLVIT